MTDDATTDDASIATTDDNRDVTMSVDVSVFAEDTAGSWVLTSWSAAIVVFWIVLLLTTNGLSCVH